MTDPIAFTSTTPRFALPNLFVAQAQKEFTVNEALARIDALLHAVVEGEANTPPPLPSDGEAWLVGAAPTGVWSGHAGAIACRQADNWLFVTPRLGLRVFDRAADREARFDNGWQRAATVAVPSGGANVDAEARAAIAGLISALVSAGLLAG